MSHELCRSLSIFRVHNFNSHAWVESLTVPFELSEKVLVNFLINDIEVYLAASRCHIIPNAWSIVQIESLWLFLIRQ
jgi:hypothetical protein